MMRRRRRGRRIIINYHRQRQCAWLRGLLGRHGDAALAPLPHCCEHPENTQRKMSGQMWCPKILGRKKKSAWPEVGNAMEKLTSSLHEDSPDSFAWKKLLKQTASIVFVVNLQQERFLLVTWPTIFSMRIWRNFTCRNCTKSHPQPQKKTPPKKIGFRYKQFEPKPYRGDAIQKNHGIFERKTDS